jgi:hypothetical protein
MISNASVGERFRRQVIRIGTRCLDSTPFFASLSSKPVEGCDLKEVRLLMGITQTRQRWRNRTKLGRAENRWDGLNSRKRPQPNTGSSKLKPVKGWNRNPVGGYPWFFNHGERGAVAWRTSIALRCRRWTKRKTPRDPRLTAQRESVES